MKVLVALILPIVLTFHDPIKVLETKDDIYVGNTKSRVQFSNASIFGEDSVTICTRFLLSNFGKENSHNLVKCVWKNLANWECASHIEDNNT